MKNAQKKGLMALAALAVLPIIFLTNCKVGLGSAVDTKAPTVAITYPSTDSVIRGKFVMSGTAEDETGIASVKVVLTKLPAALGIKSEEITGSMDTQNGKTWTASINTPDAATGAYSIADGKYEAQVTVTDTVGRTTSTTVIYTIDNTRPIVAVSQPGTRGTQNPWEFGSELNFTGLQYDENISGVFTIDFFNSDGTKISTYKGTNVLTDWALDVTEGDAAFQALKKAMADENIPQKFWYAITVEDLAYEFTNPSEASDTAKTGNSSTYYYSWTDISSLLVAGDFAPKINALYNLDSGLNVSASEMPASITYGKLKDIRIQLNTAADKVAAQFGAFTIDPNNKQPVIETDGIKAGENRSKENQIGKGETLRFEIKKNKDNTPILVNEMKTRLDTFANDKWEEVTTTVIEESEITQGTTIVYNYSAPVEVGIYRLVFDVKDLNKSSARNSTYEFIVNAGAPTFTIAPGASIYAPSGSFTAKITALDDSNALTLKVQQRIEGNLTPVTAYPNPLTTTAVTGTEDNYTSVWTLTLPAAENGQKIAYRFEVSDGKWSGSKEQTFTTDNTAPDLLELTSPAMSVVSGSGTEVCHVSTPAITVQGRSGTDIRQARIRVTTIDAAPDGDITNPDWKVVNVAADGSGKFTAALELPSDAGGVIEGRYYAWYRFADDTYDEATQQMGDVTKLFDIVADRNDPNISFTINGKDETEYEDTMDGYNVVPANFTISGLTWDAEADSSAGITSLTYSHYLGINTLVGIENTLLTVNLDGTWSLPEITGDGKHTFVFTVTDWAGKKTEEFTVKVHKDTGAPDLVINDPIEGAFKSGSITISGTVSDDGSGVADVQITLNDGATWITSQDGLTFNDANWLYTPSSDDIGDEGSKTLYVWAKDKAGQEVYDKDEVLALSVEKQALYKRNFSYDSADPVLTITSPAGNQDYTRGDSYNFAFKAEDTQSIDTLSYRLNGGSAVTVFDADTVLPGGLPNASGDREELTVNSYEISELTDGTNEILFTLTDKANKTHSMSKRIIRDTVPPEISITSVLPSIETTLVPPATEAYLINGKVIVKGSFSDNDRVTIASVTAKTGLPAGTLTIVSSNTSSFTATVDTRNLSTGQTLDDVFVFNIQDAAGNTAVTTAISTELATYVVDQASDKPELSDENFNVSVITDDGVTKDINLFSASQTLTATITDDDGIDRVDFYVNGSGTAAKSVIGNNRTVLSLDQPLSELGLTGNAFHTIKMVIVDNRLGKTESSATGINENAFRIGYENKTTSITVTGEDTLGTKKLDGDGEYIDLGQLSANKTISGTAEGSFSISSVILNSLTKTGGPGVTNGASIGDEAWTFTLEKPLSNSVAEIIAVTATDSFGRNVIKRFSYIFDLDKPTVTPSSLNQYFMKAGGASVSGTAADAATSVPEIDRVTQSGVDSIEYTIVSGEDPYPSTPIPDGDWTTLSIPNASSWTNAKITDFNTLDDGWYTIHFRAKDKSGNYSDPVSQSYYADSAAPVIKTTKDGTSLETNKWYEKGTFVLAGTLNEATYDESSLAVWTYDRYYQADVEASYGAATHSDIDLSYYEPVPGTVVAQTTYPNWSITETNPSDGKYKYVITAKDRAGYTTVITREIYIDTAPPTLEVSNIVSGNVISTNDYTYRGTLTDSPAGPNKVYYQITQNPTPADISLYPVMTGYTEVNAMTTSWAINKGNIEGTTAGIGVDEGKLHEGQWYLHLVADDTAGNLTSSVETIPFIVDLKNPVAEETTINTISPYTATVDKTGLFNSSITITDTHALKNLKVVQKRNGAEEVTLRNLDYSSIKTQTIPLNNLPHSDAVNTSVVVDGTKDGLYTYDITVTDFADKTHTITRSVRFDTQAPSISVTTPTTDGWYSTASFSANGLLSDTGSGAKNIHYAITQNPVAPVLDADYTTVSTANSWTVTKTVETGLAAAAGNLHEGTWYLHLRAEDNVGNITASASASTTKFNLDRGNPSVTETVDGTKGVGTGPAVPKTALFSLNLAASDTHALKSLTVKQKKNGAEEITVYENTALSGISFPHELTGLPNVTAGVSANVDGTDDGLYTYEITVTDIAGKTNTITRSVRFDTKAPVVTIVSPALDSWNGSTIVSVSGNAADDSGVSEVRYNLQPGSPGSAPASPATWTAFGSPTNLSASISGAGEGVNTLWLYTVDIHGNNAVTNHVFKVDTLVPSLSITGDSIRYIRTTDTNISLSGEASDTAELDKVVITVNSYTETINAPLTADKWTAAEIAKAQFTENIENIVEITAYDKYGRTKTEKVTVYYDTLAPVTNVTTVNQLLDFDGRTNVVNGTVRISGTLSDNTGIKGYKYTLTRSGFDPKPIDVPGSAANFTINLNTLDPAIMDFNGDLTADDDFELTVLVESYDASGNVSNTGTTPASSAEFSLYVDQDSDSPIITLDTFAPPVGGRYVFTSAEQIGATISDDDGIASTVRTIDSGSLIAASSVPAVGSRSGRFVQKLTGLTEGQYTLTITVTDNVSGKVTTETIEIAIDNNNPLILSDLINGEFRSSSFDITLTVTDTSDINGNPSALPNVAGVTVSGPVVSGSNYTYTVSIDDPSSFTETDVEILFTALDMYGRSSSYNFTYKVDLTKPVFDSITYPASAYINLPDSYTYRVEGTASDEAGGSDLNDVRYVVLNGDVDVDFADSAAVTAAFTASSTTWKPAAGLSPWTANVDMSGKASGVYSLYIMARDNAGNEAVTAKQPIFADTTAPVITPDAVSALNRIDFILSGTASDSDNFLKVVTAKVVNGSALTTAAGHTKDSWKFDVSTATLGNGPKQVEVTAEDESGKKVSQTISFTIDTVPPTVSFTNIEGADVTAVTTPAGYTIVTKLTGTSPKVLGTFNDATSGLKSIAYSYQRWDGSAWVVLETDSETKTSAVTSGTISRDLTTYSNTTTNPGRDGIWRVRAVATDDAGNSSAEIYSPLFIVDRTLPTVDITDPLENSIKKIEDPLLIAGNAADSNGGQLDRVEITISHPSYTPAQAAANKTSILASAMTGSLWSWNRAGGAGNSPFIYSGNYTITVIAYDKGGNIREATRRVSCDTTPPPINFTRPYLLPVTAAGFHGTAPKAGGIYPNPQVGTLIGDVLIQGSIPSTEFSNDKIYYQAGGELTVTKGGSVITINDEWFTELNDTTGVITDIGISGGFLTAGAVTPEATTGVTGSWITTTDKWNFSFNIDTIALKNAGKLYQTPGTVLPNLQTVNVYVVSIDSAGNKNVGVYPINLDTDTDKPVVEILSPEPVGGYVDLGGSFTVSGNVTDNTFVYDVYMKVELVNGNYDVNGDLRHNSTNDLFAGTSITAAGVTSGQSYFVNGTVDSTDFTNGVTNYFTNKDTWYKVNYNSSTGGWKIKLNGEGEFFNLNLEDYYVTGHPYDPADKAVLNVSVMAIDSKDAHNILSEGSVMGNEKAIIVRIDGDNPGISLDVFPDANTYVSGSMPVKVTYTDNVSVATYSLYAGSTKIFDQASSAGWTVTTVPAVAPYTSVTLEGTINTTTLPTQTVFRLDVEDDGSRVSSMMRTVYVDNDRPRDVLNGVLQPSDITTDPPVPFVRTDSYLTISTNEAVLAGKASDLVGSIEGSGIKHIVLYLTKGTGASTKIYNTELRSGGVHTKDTDGTLLTNQVSVSKFNGATYETATVYFPESSISAIRPNKEAVINNIAATPYIVVDSPNSNSDGDGDYYRENLKANKAWTVMLDSTMIPDGLYTVNYLVVDNAGNATLYIDHVLVANNPPEVLSVQLSTDVNGDGTFIPKLYTYDGSGEINASDFTITNSKFRIQVNVDSGTGNGVLTYHLSYPTGVAPITSTDGIFDIPTFPADTVINGVPDTTKNGYIVWVTDSNDVPLTSGEVDITLKLDNDDDIDPTAKLYELNTGVETSAIKAIVNNETMGSLYTTSTNPLRYSGHIEPRLSSLYNNSTQDPDVSGTIILRGNAYDNRRIKSLELVINNGTPIVLASATTGELAIINTATTQVLQTLDNTGHHVEWSYTWNTTANGSGFNAENNISVRVQVRDASNNNSDPVIYPASNHNETTVDVVPYITSVVTSLDKLSSAKPSRYNRTARGRYPVAVTNGTGETVTISGFNLLNAQIDGSASGISDNTASSFKLNIATLTDVDVVTKALTFNLTVNSIPLLNNINDNTQEWNQQPNNDNNNELTDDVYFDVWEFDTEAARPVSGMIEQPVMKIDPVNNNIGFAFVNGPLYFSMGGQIGVDVYSAQYWMGGYDFFTSVAFTYDSLGYSYGVAAGGDINSTSADKFQFMTSRWGRAGTGQTGSYGNTNSLRLESIGQKEADGTRIFNKQRIKSPSLTSAVHGTTTNVYLAYYDDMNEEIRFKYGQTDSTARTNFGSFVDFDTAGDSYVYRNNWVSMLAGSGTGRVAGEYVSIAVISDELVTVDDVVAVVWYDPSNRCLWYSYNTTPTTDRNGVTTAAGWSTPMRVFDAGSSLSSAGEYCQIVADNDGGIHIAAYDPDNLDLVYAYLTNYLDTTPETCVVDGYGVVGTNITLEVAKSGANWIPYIGYYATSCVRPKYAYKFDTTSNAPQGTIDEKVTGDWEITVVPTGRTVPLGSLGNNKINVAAWKENSGVIKNSVEGTKDGGHSGATYGATCWDTVYGNGTSNPVLGYVIKVGTAGRIETAQKR